MQGCGTLVGVGNVLEMCKLMVFAAVLFEFCLKQQLATAKNSSALLLRHCVAQRCLEHSFKKKWLEERHQTVGPELARAGATWLPFYRGAGEMEGIVGWAGTEKSGRAY